jgi:DNA polymerase III subunit gamma/tau
MCRVFSDVLPLYLVKSNNSEIAVFMTDYQVLARKWRPNKFEAFVGQDQTLQALKYALDNNTLHHAYLFTGTRGVGKTSLGRLMAKCLNCEVGVSSNPCNKCSACIEVDKGCFIDLIEIDAASRTKVEDTRELIENIQYAPTKGRYKIYLIDEVHMLSTHSFNALLKTLEEPPGHVKFLLATTDPQKLPETILSRTIQFNLKEINLNDIASHLDNILQKEGIKYDFDALSLIASHARGSMRDALSFLDLLISQGEGEIKLDLTQKSLGVAPNELIFNLLELLLNRDTANLLEFLNTKLTSGLDYFKILDSCAKWVYVIAFEQQALLSESNGFGINNSSALRVIEGCDDSSVRFVKKLASSVAPEKLQYLYQSFLRGKEEILLSPEPRIGFEMLCLRWVAFDPVSNISNMSNKEDLPIDLKVDTKPRVNNGVKSMGGVTTSMPRSSGSSDKPILSASIPVSSKPIDNTNLKSGLSLVTKPELSQEASDNANLKSSLDLAQKSEINQDTLDDKPSDILNAGNWAEFANNLSVTGLAYQVVLNLKLLSDDGDNLKLSLPKNYQNLLSEQIKNRVILAIKNKRSWVNFVDIVVDESLYTDDSKTEKIALKQKKKHKDLKKNGDLTKKLEENKKISSVTVDFNVKLDCASIEVIEAKTSLETIED